MNQESILQDQQDWHLRWLFRRMEEITERRAKGEREITVSLDWLEELLARDIGFAQSNAFLTRRLMDFANCDPLGTLRAHRGGAVTLNELVTERIIRQKAAPLSEGQGRV